MARKFTAVGAPYPPSRYIEIIRILWSAAHRHGPLPQDGGLMNDN
jgi:hypothetical protein